jgi:hypothetical protein
MFATMRRSCAKAIGPKASRTGFGTMPRSCIQAAAMISAALASTPLSNKNAIQHLRGAASG